MNKLYIIGGYNGDRGEHYGSIYCFDPEQNIWNVVKTKANCVCARRRQCAVLVGSRLFLFGGTSPDPRFVHSRGDIPEELIDHDDLHVLDLQPSLKTLSLMSVIKYGLPVDHVTSTLRFDIMMMTTDNTINRKVICNG
ncbi:KLHDC3 (predicted) [Pycnogonum litorale]